MASSYVKLFELNADHIIDYTDYENVTVYHYIPDAGGTYYYDSSTGVFSTTGAGTTYIRESYTAKVFSSSYDVEAKIRTIELITDFIRRISNLFLMIKLGINKQIRTNDTEEYTRMSVYESNSNITKNVTNKVRFTNYVDSREVNAYDGDTYSRVNGTRNYIIPEIPASSKLSNSASFEFEMTNEGRIFDLAIIQSPRMEKGGA